MCGFLVSSKINPEDYKIFEDSLNLIRYRGPDETIIHREDSISFGFNRLSIQDLSSQGSQPMIDEIGNVLCFNGEIYNFKILRKELEKIGEVFKSNSDTEVLLKLLKIHGIKKTLSLIDGMYAFVFYEKEKKVIYACRDPFGMKPLFSYHEGQRIVFSSEIKSILPLVNQKKIDLIDSLNPLFYTGMSPSSRTMFENIKSIDPGFLVKVNLKDFSLKKRLFFDLTSLVNSEDYFINKSLNDHELSEKVSEALKYSVKSHLVSDAKAGILFSAGLDSSLIAAISSNLTKDKVNLFKYQSESLDDSDLANKFAQNFDCNLEVTQNIDKNLIYKLPYLIYSYETLNKPDGTPLSMVCSNARKKGFKVLLTGDASDELFAGYGTFDQYRINQYLNSFRLVQISLKFFERIFPGIRSIGIDEMHHLISPFDDRFIKPFLNFSLFRGDRNRRWQECKDAYAFLDNNYETNVNAYLLDDIRDKLQRFLLRSDRVGMSNSIELRLPFLTKELVGLALNIPFNRKSKTSISYKRRRLFYDKAPLRKIAKNLGINNEIISRVKMGTPTGLQDENNIFNLSKKMSFKNISEIYDIKEKTIMSILNEVTYSPIKYRLHWTFISLEIYLKMFMLNVSPQEIEAEFKSLLEK